ncbi:Polyisoprenoid-binding protein YceI [Modicisalibacter ilicicola DSM 19980]|uniref:Polyisoprenoid-binding protein YceI n=1 Tax=Modicisalibacter ilicicola DSM 19980 TaxID=1121942 RepID=A0A1M4T2I0_9GAMM|nr:YceI family protein [Halomonas ilicicola]SHE38625.1 Polyisoprenoid-binding protein YceI [Halomonas ilicicola DSM 19980]
MGYRWVVGAGGLYLALAFAAVQAAPGAWAIQHDESRLGFIATQEGEAFEGEFAEFDAEMRFSKDALDESRFDVTVDVTSIDAGNSQRNDLLPDEEWFFFERFPRATYVTSTIREGDDAPFEAVGTLTLRGVEREITLPFEWRTEGDRAFMQGRVTLNRRHFDIGQGEWADDDTVAYPVEVVVDLTLERRK